MLQLERALLTGATTPLVPAMTGEEVASQQVAEVLATEFMCRRRHTLSLAKSNLYALPHNLWNISFLRLLDISGNNLTSLPAEIGGMIALRSLKISHNSLETLPPTIGKLSALNRLDASHNALESLPPSFAKMIGLQHVDLSHNRLRSLPKEILGHLKGMFYFGLEANCFLEDRDMEALAGTTTITYFVASLLHIAMTKVAAMVKDDEDSAARALPTTAAGASLYKSPASSSLAASSSRLLAELPGDLRERFVRDLNTCDCGSRFFGPGLGESLCPIATVVAPRRLLLSSKRCCAACPRSW